jgi:hypothetical protein
MSAELDTVPRGDVKMYNRQQIKQHQATMFNHQPCSRMQLSTLRISGDFKP